MLQPTKLVGLQIWSFLPISLNVIAWRYFAMGGEHTKILSLGSFATPEQVIQAMCQDKAGTIPLEQTAYEIAQLYYGWDFAVDPSDSYPSSCPGG